MSVYVSWQVVVKSLPHPPPREDFETTYCFHVDVILLGPFPAGILPEPVAGTAGEERLDSRRGEEVRGVEILADRALHQVTASRDAPLSQVVGGEVFVERRWGPSAGADSARACPVLGPVTREMVVELQVFHGRQRTLSN